MLHKKPSRTGRWVGPACAGVLLALALILLGGQVVATEGGSATAGSASHGGVAVALSATDPRIVLEKNENYYGAASVVVTQVTGLFLDDDEAWTRYQAGQLDTITPPASALETIKASATYSPQLRVFPAASTYAYAFSADVDSCDDPLLRAALSSAIDRQGLIDDVLTGDELPALTLTPPRHFGHVDGYAENIGWPYSPTVANDLLDQSGYTGDPPITLLVNTYAHHEAVAAAVAQMWEDTLGITVSVENLDWSAYQNMLRNGSVEERPCAFRMGWGSDIPDAHNWHGVAWKGFYMPWSRYDNPAYEALVEDAAAETVAATRLELYEQAEATLVMTDTIVAPLYYAVEYGLTLPDLDRTYHSFGAQHVDEWSFSADPRPLEVVWGRPATLDPARSGPNSYVEQLFLALTDYDIDTGEVVPELATSWEVSADATVFTFTLRSDATWTDGKTVKAGDVEYGVLRSLHPATRSNVAWMLFDIQNASEYNSGEISDPDQVGVEALDDTHIRFTLTAPAAYFPAVVASPPARPQPKWAIDAHGSAWIDPANIVSNGPYKLTHWDQAPYLSIHKGTSDEPQPGETMVFDVRYWNDGGDAAENCVISDTLESASYISDTSGLPHTGTGTEQDPIVWQLGTLPGYSSGQFQVYAQVTGTPGHTVRNRVQIATDDLNDQGDPGEKESEWWGDIRGPWMYVNYGSEKAGGAYAVGHTFLITVTDSLGTVKATATADTEVGGGGPDGTWEDGFEVESQDWTPQHPDIRPGDRVYFDSDDGYDNTVVVGTLTGGISAGANMVSGAIQVPWLASQTVNVIVGSWGFPGFQETNVTLDAMGRGSYGVDFSPTDLTTDMELGVNYVEPDGDRVYNVVHAWWQVYLPVVVKMRGP